MPSSAARPVGSTPALAVAHEDLVFHCRDRQCQVTARYTIQAEAAVAVDLDFILPVAGPVTAQVGGTSEPAAVSRLRNLPRGFPERLDLRHEYQLPDSQPLPDLYQAVARAALAPGENQVSFSYAQTLGAVEAGRSYFSAGRMVPRLLYVLWPLREWTLAPGFAIALRIEMDRPAPGWWVRTFGHPAQVTCAGIEGQQTQVGPRLVYTAMLSRTFPDYLRCSVGR
jgi:hypothetical protein